MIKKPLTRQQQELLTLLTENPEWSIRQNISHGHIQTYLWNHPLGLNVNARVFDGLRNRGLLQKTDDRLNIWRPSAREASE